MSDCQYVPVTKVLNESAVVRTELVSFPFAFFKPRL